MSDRHAQAEAMIESMGGLDAALADGGTVELPLNQSTAQETTQANTPDQQTQVTPQENQSLEASFAERFDPNALPPELQARYREMNADYTRKTQEIAEQRKQFEQYGDLQQVEQALGLYQALQDPTNWVQLHEELTENLRAMGLTQAEAEQAATQQLVQEQESQAQLPDLSQLDDPDLEPFKQYIEGLKNELYGVKSSFDQYKQEQERQQMEMILAGEQIRMENAIRQSNPHYSDNDINAIHELSSFYDGDMFTAQQRYDAMFQDRVTRWLEAKQAAIQQQAVQPLAGAEQTTQQPKEIKSFDDARAAALEYAAQLSGMDWS